MQSFAANISLSSYTYLFDTNDCGFCYGLDVVYLGLLTPGCTLWAEEQAADDALVITILADTLRLGYVIVKNLSRWCKSSEGG